VSNEVTLGIRITADGKEASAEVKTVVGDIDKLGQSSSKTTSESQRLNDALRNQTAQMASASQAFRQNSEAVSRTADDVTRLIDRYDPLSAKLRQLQADFKALDQAARSGSVAAIDDARLDAAYAKIQSEIKAAQAAVSGFGATANAGFAQAAEGAEKAAFSTVGARRELMVLGHEAMSGNFSRVPGSMMVLAERTNFTMASIFGLGGAITAAVAAVAAFAVAIKMGAEESDAYARALILTGNAAGETASGLQAMAGNVAAATGATQHFAAEVLAELASGGKVAADGLQQAAQAAIDMERAGGPAAEETVKQFNELGKSPVEASLKLNDATHFLTESVYLQIKALEDQGNKAAAAALAESAYARDVEQKTDELRDHLGTLQRYWRDVKDGAKSAWDAMLNIGRPTTLDEAQAKLEKMKQSLSEYQQGNLGRFFAPTQADIDAQQKYVDKLKENAAAESAAATAKAEYNKQQQAAIAFDQAREQHLDKTTKMWREIAQAEIEGTQGGKSQAEILSAITEIQSRYADKTKTSAKAAKDSYDSVYGSVAKLNAELMAGSDSQDKMTRAQKLALDTMVGIQNGTIKLTEAEKIRVSSMLESALALDKQATAQKAAQAAGEAYRQEMEAEDAARQKVNDSLDKEIDKLKEHGEEIGLSKAALDALIISRQDDAIATAEQTLRKAEESDASAQEIIDLNKTITLLKERRSILESNQWKQSAADAADASAKEWQKGWDETDRLAREVFTDWATQGKNAAQKIGDTLKKALLSAIYEATLKPIAFQIYGSLTGGGMAGAIAGPGGGGLLNMASNASSAYSMFNGGMSVMGDYALGSMGIGSGVTQGAMLAAQTGDFGLAGATATADALGGAAGGLAAIPGWGWAALGAVALGSMFGGKGGGPKTNGEWATGIGDNGVLSDLNKQPGSSITMAYKSADVKQISDQAAATITSTLKALGASSSGMRVGLYYNTDPQGTAPDNVGARMTDSHGNLVYNSTYDTGRGQGSAQLATEGKRMTMAAISAADVDPIFKAIVNGLGDIKTASTEMMDAAMAQINDVSTIKDYVKADPLKDAMNQIALSSSSATDAMQRHNDALMAMISTYDGSAAATKNLAAATQGQYQLEMQMIQQIQSALSATHSMYTDSIESIKMSVMDNPAKYDYLRTQADTLYQQLSTASDPAKIQGLADQINKDINAAYGLLDADQQKGAAGDFVAYLTKVDDLTTKRLNESQDAITKEHNDLAAKLTAKMDEAAARLNDAAAALKAAADKPTPPATVTIYNATNNAEVSVA
jgi:hypothetical protein